jgi:Tol biopolymer transport system component
VVETLLCTPLSAGGNSVIGTRPQWSPDEQSVYFLRTSSDGGCCAVWIVDREGSNSRALIEMTGYSASNSLFGIDADGGVIFNHTDRSGDEIWVVAAE